MTENSSQQIRQLTPHAGPVSVEDFWKQRSPAPLQRLKLSDLTNYGVAVYLKREDLSHPAISGNKWRKLKYNLIEAKRLGHQKFLTFGGAFSNHIAATAAAGGEFGFETIGIIRGEETMPLNPVLSRARENGMLFHYLDRTTYRHKTEADVLAKLKDKFGNFYLVPEGGSNALAVRGCAEIVSDISSHYDHIVCPVGTGGTLAGLISGIGNEQTAIGISVLKGGGFLNDEVKRLLPEKNQHQNNWRIELDYHFGGYAKSTTGLLGFIERFQDEEQVTLDSIYTGKMMFGICDLIRKEKFSKGTVIVAIHTGRNSAASIS